MLVVAFLVCLLLIGVYLVCLIWRWCCLVCLIVDFGTGLWFGGCACVFWLVWFQDLLFAWFLCVELFLFGAGYGYVIVPGSAC